MGVAVEQHAVEDPLVEVFGVAQGMWPGRRSGLEAYGTQPLICLGCQPSGDDLAKGRVVHEAHEDLLVLVHALYEEGLQKVLEDQLKLIAWIHLRSLLEGFIEQGYFCDLIEEQLVGLVEIRYLGLLGDIVRV